MINILMKLAFCFLGSFCGALLMQYMLPKKQYKRMHFLLSLIHSLEERIIDLEIKIESEINKK